MATINNIYIFVEDENLNRSSSVPQHPVEKGLSITDNVREELKTLSISGKIVSAGNLTAAAIISKIDALRTSGSLIKYSGRNVLGNFLIQSFNTTHPNTVWGGAEFSMELIETRIAKSAYNPKKSTNNTSNASNNNNASAPTLKEGAIVVFKGGSVYVSSDAKKAAATRGRQTCKITKISNQSWSVHQYHLISTEKKYPYNVYGWVDKANIEGTGSAGTAATTNAGTQQVTTK